MTARARTLWALGIFASAMVLVALAAGAAQATVVSQPIEYKIGDEVFEGTIAFDDKATTPRPGVLVVHQWMGPTEHEFTVAKHLAALGYVAFVADIYGKGVRPKNPDEAGAQAGKFKNDRALLRARAAGALEAMKAQPQVDPAKVAAIGYCFGGMGALELARAGAPLLGVVSFHGTLNTPTPADAKNIHGKVLVLHGEADPYVKADEVAAFKKEMDDAGVTYTFIGYPGAVHAFTQKSAGFDPSKGAAYNANADVKSWQAMKDFLAAIFA
ncbi:MAG: dienelactone hydrolase family protein [Deltaproteobacteria bacterium]|nr:dienelactone hydrolase family protein [Deltaproteobacteria bacterium]